MLAVNNRLLNYNDKTDPYVLEYEAAVKEIRSKFKFPIQIKDKFGKRINPTGANEPDKVMAIPLTANIISKNGSPEFWRYAPGYPQGKDMKPSKTRLIVKRGMFIQANEMELAFFMLYKSEQVKNGTLQVVDRQKDAKKKIAARSKMISTRYLLYDEKSPAYAANETLREVALAFGVSHATNEDYSIEEIKIALENVIEQAEMNGDTERDERAFKNALDLDEMVQKRAAVQRAVDQKIIEFKYPQWILIDKDGRKQDNLCTVSTQDLDRKEEVLVNYLKRNVYYRDLIEETTNQEGIFSKKEELSKEMVSTMKRPELMAWCKKKNLKNYATIKDEQMRQMLMEAL